MARVTDVLELTRRLVALETVDGDESAACAVLAELLDAAGFIVAEHAYAPGRGGLIADWETAREAPPLCLSGHLDTVPLGATPWKQDPFAGEIDGDRLYGRGVTDMKGGVAAIVTAAVRAVQGRSAGRAGLRLVLTAAEEIGSVGARHLIGRLPDRRAGVLMIAEPTANEVVHGHKGALWLKATATGVTAHGSMPHLGENAVYKLARAVTRLAEHAFPDEPHPVMGAPTLNVGTFQAGRNVNSVPDHAEAAIDVRTVAGQSHDEVGRRLARTAGSEVTLDPIIDLPPVWTDPDGEWVQVIGEIAAEVTGAARTPRAATYFTDAAVLTPALGAVPTLIFGPGEPGQAHVTDEWCSVTRLRESADIYERVIRRYCDL